MLIRGETLRPIQFGDLSILDYTQGHNLSSSPAKPFDKLRVSGR